MRQLRSLLTLALVFSPLLCRALPPEERPPAPPELVRAIQKGSVSDVRKYVDAGDADLATFGSYDDSLLHLAIRANRPGIATFLIEAGAPLDEENKAGLRPLAFAAREGHLGLVIQLLASGKVDIEAQNHAGETALILAVYRKHEEIVGRLLAAGASPNKPANHNSPLSYAIKGGSSNIYGMLLENGAEVDGLTKPEGATPLLIALARDSLTAVRTLLDAGAEPTVKDAHDRTALMYACYSNPERYLDDLVKKGCRADQVDKDGASVLSYAAWSLRPESVDWARKHALPDTHLFLPPSWRSPAPAGGDASTIPPLAVLPALLDHRHESEPARWGGRNPGRSVGDCPCCLLRRMFSIRSKANVIEKVGGFMNGDPYRHLMTPATDTPDPTDAVAIARRLRESKADVNSISPEKSLPVWQSTMAIHIAGLAVQAGYLTPDEATQLTRPAAQHLRSSANSWNELLDLQIRGLSLAKGFRSAHTDLLHRLFANPHDPSHPENIWPWRSLSSP